jgi:membrane protease subunit HflK
MNSGPWGSWENSNKKPQEFNGQKNNDKNQQNKPEKPDFEELLKKLKEKFNNFFKNKNSGKYSDKSMVGLALLSLITIWLASGFYKVEADENAVTLYFGKFYSVTTPGLNYHIPFPFGEVIKKSIISVNTEEFGFASSKKSSNRDFSAESLMLTGDENIVDIEFQVQWQISDIKNFVFNIAEPNQSIRKAAESAMREIIARTPIVSALSDGKSKIEQEAKELLQEILDYYGAGVRVAIVQLLRVDPPTQVIDAFRDVQTAKADREKEINQAQSYANDVLPKAQGMAAQMLKQSEAYSKEVVTNAEGEAGRFLSVYNQYVKSKQITRKRMYLETMEKIYHDMDKVFIDKNSAKSGVIPYFPMTDITQQNPNKKN